MSSHGSVSSEVQVRVTKGYLERLNQRVNRMRKLYAEREWPLLREECLHLKNSATGFGFPDLAQLATRLDDALSNPENSRAKVMIEVKTAAESLFLAIDDILIADAFARN